MRGRSGRGLPEDALQLLVTEREDPPQVARDEPGDEPAARDLEVDRVAHPGSAVFVREAVVCTQRR